MQPLPVISGTLEYDPAIVDLVNPDCIIENGNDELRVTNAEFLEQGGKCATWLASIA